MNTPSKNDFWQVTGLSIILLLILMAACAPAINHPQIDFVPLAPVPAQDLTTPVEKVVSLATATLVPPEITNTETLSGSAGSTEEAWTDITPPGETVKFRLPASFRHYGQDTLWSPDEGKTIIGLRESWNRPGAEVEDALLPDESLLLGKSIQVINGLSISCVRLVVYVHQKTPLPEGQHAPVRGYELHYITIRPDSMVFDFFASAETEEELSVLEPTMRKVLESVQFAN